MKHTSLWTRKIHIASGCALASWDPIKITDTFLFLAVAGLSKPYGWSQQRFVHSYNMRATKKGVYRSPHFSNNCGVVGKPLDKMLHQCLPQGACQKPVLSADDSTQMSSLASTSCLAGSPHRPGWPIDFPPFKPSLRIFSFSCASWLTLIVREGDTNSANCISANCALPLCWGFRMVTALETAASFAAHFAADQQLSTRRT